MLRYIEVKKKICGFISMKFFGKLWNQSKVRVKGHITLRYIIPKRHVEKFLMKVMPDSKSIVRAAGNPCSKCNGSGKIGCGGMVATGCRTQGLG